MNKQRRAALGKIVATIYQAYADLETINNEEQDAYDNLPDSLRDGDKGEAMQEAIDNMESALQGLEDAKDYLTDLANG